GCGHRPSRRRRGRSRACSSCRDCRQGRPEFPRGLAGRRIFSFRPPPFSSAVRNLLCSKSIRHFSGFAGLLGGRLFRRRFLGCRFFRGRLLCSRLLCGCLFCRRLFLGGLLFRSLLLAALCLLLRDERECFFERHIFRHHVFRQRGIGAAMLDIGPVFPLADLHGFTCFRVVAKFLQHLACALFRACHLLGQHGDSAVHTDVEKLFRVFQ